MIYNNIIHNFHVSEQLSSLRSEYNSKINNTKEIRESLSSTEQQLSNALAKCSKQHSQIIELEKQISHMKNEHNNIVQQYVFDLSQRNLKINEMAHEIDSLKENSKQDNIFHRLRP